MSPFNAWVFLKGLETLGIRMRAHSENALTLAQWLASHPKVDAVHHPGLETHPQHTLAKQQQSNWGGVLSFEVKGGQNEAWQVVDNTRLLSITANLGDTKTTITHPATTTHGRLSPEARAEAGIKDNLLRIAVGLETIDDVKADLERGLAKI
jgi:O-succinylhomoserine sulfhydrylase